MAEKQAGQFSFVEALAPQLMGGNGRLDRLHGLVKWYRFEKVLSSLREGGSGRPAYPCLLMFKVLLLQSLYGLSDAEMEEALVDRLSFRRFAGLALTDAVPDHTTICRFRNLLVAQAMLKKLFGELDKQLDEAGLILRRGTMLDATVIETTAARPGPGETASDPEARYTRRKRKGLSFVYKAHVGVDQGSGLIRSVRTTTANVHDTVPADELIRGDERAVLGDAAYHTHAREAALKARRIKPRLMRRAHKYHPVLSPRLKRYNRLIARQRGAVETTFATLKRRMGLGVIRYRGLAKAEGQVMIAVMAFNLRRWVTLAST
jgi:IS5 family transposase